MPTSLPLERKSQHGECTVFTKPCPVLWLQRLRTYVHRTPGFPQTLGKILETVTQRVYSVGQLWLNWSQLASLSQPFPILGFPLSSRAPHLRLTVKEWERRNAGQEGCKNPGNSICKTPRANARKSGSSGWSEW